MSWQLWAGFKQTRLFLERLHNPNQADLTHAAYFACAFSWQLWGLSPSAAASALAFTQQWRAEMYGVLLVPVLAAILAVSGISPWFQDLPQNLLVLTHAAFILLLTSDERRGGEKRILGPEGMLFCIVPQPTAGLYSQACNTDIAMWL